MIFSWRCCSVIGRMYELGLEVVREWLCQPGLSRALRLGVHTRELPTQQLAGLREYDSEREDEAAESKNIHSPKSSPTPSVTFFEWCCFDHFLRKSLEALLEALFARIFLDLRFQCAVICVCVYVPRFARPLSVTRTLLPPLPTRLLCLVLVIPPVR